jgi:gas vesicle protein
MIVSNKSYMSSTGKFILGLLGAAAAGTVIGMLIAPAKGSDTRKKMIEGVGKLAIDVANLIQSGKDAQGVIADEAEGLKNDIKQRVRNVEESVA